MELQSKDTALVFKISHKQPIEMADFISTMHSLGALFEDFARKNTQSTELRKAKLYVEKIEHGSIEFFLSEIITACAIPFAENFNIIYEFAKNLCNMVQGATTGVFEEKYTITQLRELRDFFAITAHDPHSSAQFGIADKSSGNIVFNNCNITFSTSNAAQNVLRNEIERMESQEPQEVTYTKQLMTIFQMRGNISTDTGNKAVIEALISGKPLPVIFDTDALKTSILKHDDNPTKQAFSVDVVIQYVAGKPAAYKITALHDIIPLED